MEPTKLPQRIDEPPLFLFWRVDDLAPVMVATVIGILVDYMVTSMAIGVLLVRFTKRYREAKPEGFLLHWFYWMGYITGHKKSRSMVNPYSREWSS